MKIPYYLSVMVFILLTISSCQVKKQSINIDPSVEANAIELVLQDQQTAWNMGDIETFMLGYWNSEELSFGGKNGFTRGYDNVLARYQKAYPNQDIMGQLKFDILDIELTSNTTAYVLGKYNLDAKDGKSSGYFTLVWRKIDGKWLIVSDHTSG